jgi:hypothetical protein
MLYKPQRAKPEAHIWCGALFATGDNRWRFTAPEAARVRNRRDVTGLDQRFLGIDLSRGS